MSAKGETGRFVGLDGLRGIAAILVLACHVPNSFFIGVAPNAYLAVDLFFVLSGFVLAYAYQQRLSSGMSVVRFMQLRLVRLYPLYILGSLVGVAAVLAGTQAIDGPAFVTSLVAALLFLPSPLPLPPSHFAYPFNFPAWSLFFELFINVVFAIVMPRFGRRGLIVTMAIGLVALVGLAIGIHGLNAGSLLRNFVGGFGRVIFSFFCGVALYGLQTSAKFPKFTLPVWLPVAMLLGLFVTPASPAMRPVFDFLANAVFFPLIVLAGANTAPKGVTARTFAVLGLASYGFYVLQMPLIMSLDVLLPASLGRDLGSFGPAGTIAVAVALFLLALAADAFYDAPVRNWLQKKLRSPRLKTAEQPG
ncbi:MAG TPA: acyltransferase [Hyphomonadaceae bacterium]|nr:acyltransferase [Hyphomonadaceae bacterium]